MKGQGEEAVWLIFSALLCKNCHKERDANWMLRGSPVSTKIEILY